MSKEMRAILDSERAEGRVEGRAEGRIEGRAEGKAEGRAEGKKEGMIEAFISMVKSGLIEIADAAKELGMSKKEFTKLVG